jgi:CDP-paratose 2-epimerase
LIELFQLLQERTGVPPRFKRLPERFGDQKVFIADCRKAGKDFSWKPRVSKEQGIEKTFAWAQEISKVKIIQRRMS